MKDTRFQILPFLRLVIWAVLMCVTALVVGSYSPRKAVFVPCVFIALIVPIVLLPIKNKPEKS